MSAENDPLMTALLRYATPVALLGIALTLGFLAWLLSL